MHLALYCLPCAGASAAMYLRWRRLLPPWIDVRPLELPGRGSRLGEGLLTDPHALVDDLFAALRRGGSAPSALFGHSMGGLLAYELAHRLHAVGMTPQALFVAGCPAPTQRDRHAYATLRSDAQLREKLDELGGTPREVFDDPELLRLTLDILGADFRICGNYEKPPRAPLPIPIHVLAGRDDAVTAAALHAWQHESLMAPTVTLFDGGHFFIQSAENAVLDYLHGCLRPLRAPAELTG